MEKARARGEEAKKCRCCEHIPVTPRKKKQVKKKKGGEKIANWSMFNRELVQAEKKLIAPRSVYEGGVPIGSTL